MSDITEDLRVNSCRRSDETPEQASRRRLMVEMQAADEIDRLRARIALLEGAAPVWPGNGGDGEPKYMREAATKITEGMA